MRRNICLIVALAVCGAASLISAQPAATALPSPPAGFKAIADSASTVAMRANGMADFLEAEKPNEGWPNCYIDPKVRMKYGWTLSPGGETVVRMMAEGPEDPPRQTGGMRDEPAGKQLYKNGAVSWRKVTTVAVGSGGNCREVVSYSGTWVGYSAGKLISVSIANLYQSKDAGQAWIEAYAGKLIGVVNAPK